MSDGQSEAAEMISTSGGKMAVQLKEGAWKLRCGKKAIVKGRDDSKEFCWFGEVRKDGYETWRPNGKVTVRDNEENDRDIIGPWEETPDPGPGYRLATEKDVGATVFGLSDGKEWHDFNGYLSLNSDGWANYRAPTWKYARVPVSPQFVPGEWYCYQGVKEVYVGLNPVDDTHIFVTEGNGICRADSSQLSQFSPWTEPPAFRLCTGVINGEKVELVKPRKGEYFIDENGYKWTVFQVTVERWHEEGK